MSSLGSHGLRAVTVAMLQLAQCYTYNQPTSPLEKLNSTLGGRLNRAEPLAAPCFWDPQATDCVAYREVLASNYPDYFRSNHYQGFQYIQSEACIADPTDQCLLNDSNLSPSNNTPCRQGSVSPYFVEITGASDVQQILKYAQENSVALSIKNGGHDYAMRNSRQDSIAIWTKGLTHKKYTKSFVPHGCTNSTPIEAVEFGAGVSMDDAYTFAHAHGVIFVGGTVATIGASGGWLLGGGHGVLTGTHGLGVDRVLEFKIVTPDGVVRIANHCTNPDLFWALRGGGTGSFGVVLSSTHMVSPEMPITGSIISFPATEDNQREYVSTLMENTPRWRLQGWTGPSYLNTTLLSTPLLNVSEAEDSLRLAVEYAERQNGSAVFHRYESYFDYYVNVINGTWAAPQPIITGLFITSRVITEDAFADSASRERLVDAIFEVVETTGAPPSLMFTPPYLYGRMHPTAARDTSIHPAWYEAPLMVLATTSFRPSSSLDERKISVAALRNTTELFKSVAPNGCAYANEGDPWLEEWESHIWGDNYPRLLDLKRKYDPAGLLSCWHCVGWSSSIPGYECISGLS
ncbi:hypothetical protein GGS21DRAFT_74343 [Xylaria nigripes]|nr:hypothetical protein GGS21DRAFT_74343 [Xylaria nigripes]